MNIQNTIEKAVKEAFKSIYNTEINSVEFQATRKDFEGDITIVVFAFLRFVKGNPVEIGTKIGEYLKENIEEVSDFNVVKGFLNLVIADTTFINDFNKIYTSENFGVTNPNPSDKAVMVEYSSPNTNKPLHLGHIRNNLLGYSVAEIIAAAGNTVYKTQIINDRGIHICKSMLAWKKYGKDETPESTGLKGDKLVGNYYVKFDQEFKKQLAEIFKLLSDKLQLELTEQNEYNLYEALKNIDNSNNYFSSLGSAVKDFYIFDNKIQIDETGPNLGLSFSDDIDFLLKESKNNEGLKISKTKFLKIFSNLYGVTKYNDEFSSKDVKKVKELLEEKLTSCVEILREAQNMLLKWEAGDKETVALWKMMNQWVYDGFDVTYKELGVDFDKNYYESNTYLLGKDVVANGLESGVFYRKEDGSVWIDLTDEGLDEKIVLRSDGTAVYMTQDIGTAIERYKDYDLSALTYTVGNEQDYHFKVLFLILKKLGFDWADNLFHLSYGMVDLPSGKMKSREGTVVDADDLMIEMVNTARDISEELGKLEGYSNDEKESLYKTIGLGALKYYILKVDPKKRILFDPKESIDFNGNTGPFIQYTYARIQSILRKADFDINQETSEINLHPKEKEVIKQLQLFPEVIQAGAKNHSPALIANYTYELVKAYNSFYQSVPILGSTNLEEKTFRTQLSKKVGDTIKSAFNLLGIDVPERM